MDNRPRGRGRGRGQQQQQGQGQGPSQHRPGQGPPPQQQQRPQQQQYAPPQQQQQQQQPRAPPQVQAARQAPPQAQSQDRDIARGMQQLSVSGHCQRGDGPEDRRNRLEQLCLVTKPATMVKKTGTSGVPVKIKANYFSLVTTTDWTLLQYRVDMSPEVELTRTRKQLLQPHRSTLGGYIFDGSSLYLTKSLGPSPPKLHSTHPTSEEIIEITFKLTAQLVPGDFHYLQVFNILMKRCYTYMNLRLIGRDYFDSLQIISLAEYGLQLWPGYRSTINQYEKSILMVCDIIHKVIRTETAYDILMRCKDRNNFVDEFKAAMLGKVVMTNYNNKTYMIDDVDPRTTPNSKFPYRDGEITYVEYYRSKYGVTIRDCNQPLLISRAKARDIRAGMSEIIYLIPEICVMTGFSDEMRANFHVLKAVTNHTNVNPKNRVNKLYAFNNRLQNTPQIKADLKDWNMTLGKNLVEVPGRVLNPQEIVQGNDKKYSSATDNHYWNKELRSNTLFASPKINNWAIIIPQRIKQEGDKFVQMLNTAARGMNIPLSPPIVQYIENDSIPTYMNTLENIISRQTSLQFVVCGVTNNNENRYSAIKKKCYVDRAIPSQVVTRNSMTNKAAMSIATNIMVQIACKVGGTPWAVNIPLKTAMFIGYDVCHDSKDKSKSFGAMVATVNPAMTQYFSVVTPHRNGEELANEFAINIVKAVTKYKEINQKMPSPIIIFRDGVGEGQLAFVYQHEVQMIRQALTDLFGGENYKLGFVVVTKRINTRFFDNNDMNPKPGTIVDDVVTMPHRYDFFLVSQSVRNGTVAPTSYNIIYDNTGLSADHFHQLAYKLCHLYFNYTGPIRVPAHCHNAHKLAFLVSQNLHAVPSEALRNTLYYL